MSVIHRRYLTFLNALLRYGITAFSDLTQEDDGLLPYFSLIGAASYRRFPIRDVSIPESPETTIAILDAIDHCLESDQTVYAHCWGGIGRTRGHHRVLVGGTLWRRARGSESFAGTLAAVSQVSQQAIAGNERTRTVHLGLGS